jgi:hypothetical protein
MFQLFLSTLYWLASAQGTNVLFAVLCCAAVMGVPGRIVMGLSALLYVGLALG